MGQSIASAFHWRGNSLLNLESLALAITSLTTRTSLAIVAGASALVALPSAERQILHRREIVFESREGVSGSRP